MAKKRVRRKFTSQHIRILVHTLRKACDANPNHPLVPLMADRLKQADEAKTTVDKNILEAIKQNREWIREEKEEEGGWLVTSTRLGDKLDGSAVPAEDEPPGDPVEIEDCC